MQHPATNILITGANGQLGNELCTLSAQYPKLNFVLTDINELDITNEANIHQVIENNNIELVINCAAFTAVDKAESNQQLAHLLNAEAPEKLAKAINQRGGEMIHISTDYVYGDNHNEPYTEDILPAPQSVYGSTKLEGEQRVIAACPKSIIIRTAWLYSTFGNNFVKTMLRLGKEREQLNVVFDQIGTPTYARDLAKAIMTIVTCPAKTYGIFHYTNEGAISWYDFTKAIHRIAGITSCHVSPIRSAQYPTPAKRPSYSLLDKTKIKQTYHIDIPYWEDSLTQCVGALLAQDTNSSHNEQ